MRKVTISIFFDFSKAFDSLGHDLLINKLRNLGFSYSVLSWMWSYLQDRKQVVCDHISRKMSSERKVSSGIPQESVLGPLLFVLYLLDFNKILRHCKYNFYADDLLVYIHNELGRLGEAVEKVNQDIANMNGRIDFL